MHDSDHGFDPVGEMPQRLLNMLNSKEAWFLPFLTGLASILAPLKEIVVAMLVLIVIDFVTGVYAAVKYRESVAPEKMINTVSKFFMYNFVILSGFLVERFILPEIPLVKVISGFISLTELNSIFRNFNRIYGIDLRAAIRQWVGRHKDTLTPPENEKDHHDSDRDGNRD